MYSLTQEIRINRAAAPAAAAAAAAHFLKVAPARDPRVANPDPAVVDAVYWFAFWSAVTFGFGDNSSREYAAKFAGRIESGWYRDNPAEWAILRRAAEHYAD